MLEYLEGVERGGETGDRYMMGRYASSSRSLLNLDWSVCRSLFVRMRAYLRFAEVCCSSIGLFLGLF
jgi:hypothetical protein